MPHKINITGTAGKNYNLDDIQNIGNRSNSSEGLVVQVWNWNPNLPEPHNQPNPNDLVIGQIWLSKLVKANSAEYRALMSKDGE